MQTTDPASQLSEKELLLRELLASGVDANGPPPGIPFGRPAPPPPPAVTRPRAGQPGFRDSFLDTSKLTGESDATKRMMEEAYANSLLSAARDAGMAGKIAPGFKGDTEDEMIRLYRALLASQAQQGAP